MAKLADLPRPALFWLVKKGLAGLTKESGPEHTHAPL